MEIWKRLGMLVLSLCLVGCDGRDASPEDLSERSDPTEAAAPQSAGGSELEAPTSDSGEARVEAENSDLLGALAAAGTGAGTAHLNGEVSFEYALSEELFGVPEVEMRQDFELWYQEPDRLRVEGSGYETVGEATSEMFALGGVFGQTYRVVMGDSSLVYDSKTNGYALTPVTTGFQIGRSPEEMLLALPSLIDKLNSSYDLVDEGIETVEGRSARVILARPKPNLADDEPAMADANHEMRCWLALDDRRLVRTQMSGWLLPPEEREAMLGSADIAYDITTTARLREADWNAEIDEARFSLVPPEGAEQVPDLGSEPLGPLP